MKNILAIETALGAGKVALRYKSEIRESEISKNTENAKYLVSAIESLMEEADCSYELMDALAISIGPGSFTGMRIGIAAAKGIAIARDIPLIAFSTFELLVWNKKISNSNIISIVHAINDMFYVQEFSKESLPISKPYIETLSKIKEMNGIIVREDNTDIITLKPIFHNIENRAPSIFIEPLYLQPVYARKLSDQNS